MTVGDFQHALKEFDLQQEEVHQSSALVTITNLQHNKKWPQLIKSVIAYSII